MLNLVIIHDYLHLIYDCYRGQSTQGNTPFLHLYEHCYIVTGQYCQLVSLKPGSQYDAGAQYVRRASENDGLDQLGSNCALPTLALRKD